MEKNGLAGFMRRIPGGVPYVISLGAAIFSAVTGSWFGVVINLSAFVMILLTNSRSDQTLTKLKQSHEAFKGLIEFMAQYEQWKESARIVMTLKEGDAVIFGEDATEGIVRELYTVGCIADCEHGPEVVLYRDILERG
jgi:hypothetical protein